eukprot:gene6760-6977_t
MGPPQVIGPDHIVLRVRDPAASVQWYASHLGLEPVRLEEYKAGQAKFPSCKVTPTFYIDFMKRSDNNRAAVPVDVNLDHFCLAIAADDINTVKQQLLEAGGIKTEQQLAGEALLVRRSAVNEAMSIYIRDPDRNMVELRTYSNNRQTLADKAEAPAAE